MARSNSEGVGDINSSDKRKESQARHFLKLVFIESGELYNLVCANIHIGDTDILNVENVYLHIFGFDTKCYGNPTPLMTLKTSSWQAVKHSSSMVLSITFGLLVASLTNLITGFCRQSHSCVIFFLFFNNECNGVLWVVMLFGLLCGKVQVVEHLYQGLYM